MLEKKYPRKLAEILAGTGASTASLAPMRTAVPASFSYDFADKEIIKLRQREHELFVLVMIFCQALGKCVCSLICRVVFRAPTLVFTLDALQLPISLFPSHASAAREEICGFGLLDLIRVNQETQDVRKNNFTHNNLIVWVGTIF